MTNSIRRQIMLRAHAINAQASYFGFAYCLKFAWFEYGTTRAERLAAFATLKGSMGRLD